MRGKLSRVLAWGLFLDEHILTYLYYPAMQTEAKLNVICFGDSITQASDHAEADRWTVILQNRLNQVSPGGYAVYNRGINGNTTAQGLDRFQAEVLPLLPGLLVLEFGLNDANCKDWCRKARVNIVEFEANLREFVRLAQASGGQALLIANHRPYLPKATQGDGRSYLRRVDNYNSAIRRVATDTGSALIDMARKLKTTPPDRARVLADGVHLSTEGNRRYAAIIFDTIIAPKD